MENIQQKHFRDSGFKVGFLPSGALGTISDVEGVRVGHVTRVEGDDIRTGVTVIDPGVPDLFHKKLQAAAYVGNGYGKTVGLSQLAELGTLETPIALTNTLAVGPVMRALVDITIKNNSNLKPHDSINAVVGEVNDGRLNALHKNIITGSDVEKAYAERSVTFLRGNVGGGTGARAFSWKGGIGTASREVSVVGLTYTLGVLIQTNFGGSLTILGVPVGEVLGKNDYENVLPGPDGSCMIVVATDAPLTPRQLGRIAKRTILGLARTGSILANSSGDYALAFSTNSDVDAVAIPDSSLDGFFLAAVEATEESVYDALFSAETMKGRDGVVLEALPTEEVIKLLHLRLMK